MVESAGFIREILSSATFREENGSGVVAGAKDYLNGPLTADTEDESRSKFVVGNACSGGAPSPFPYQISPQFALGRGA